VLTAGPFTQINQPATFAAEREILSRALHRLFAGGALHLDFSLADHRLIVDANAALGCRF
jgi:hypothetical protein